MSTRCVTMRMRASAKGANRKRRVGFTILEVLVAMFVLLVGGLAIMNIFPPALRVIRGSENREIAIAMTQSTLERYANDPKTIPDAVYNDDGSGVWVDASGAVAGTRNRNFSLPADATSASYSASALGNVRRINGEKHRVLEDRTGITGSNPGVPFILSSFSQIGTPNFFVEEDVLGVTTDTSGNLDFRNSRLQSDETQSLSDTTTPRNLAANWNNTNPGLPALQYYVSYRWNDGTGNINGAENEKLAVSSATPQLFQGRIPPANRVISGEISLRVRIPVIGVPTPNLSQASIGFLPLRATAGVAQDAIGRSINIGDVVSVDYTVRDWRYLMLDVNADTPTAKTGLTGTSRDIKLPISTLSTDTANPLSSNPLFGIVLDKTGASTFTTSAVGRWSSTPPFAPILDINPASATFDVSGALNPQVRVSYAASRGWAHQISVAAQSYYLYSALRTPAAYDATTAILASNEREPWREYYWTPNSSIIYLRPSEAGKTLLVSFRAGGSVISNQVVPVSSRIIQRPTSGPNAVPATFGSYTVAEATLTNSTGDALSATAILSVRGASIRSRTAWIENNNYVQEVKEDYRPLND